MTKNQNTSAVQSLLFPSQIWQTSSTKLFLGVFTTIPLKFVDVVFFMELSVTLLYKPSGRHLNASRYRLTVGGETWRMTCWLKLSTSCLTESHSIWTFSLESCARIRVEQRFVTANKFFNQNTSINKFFYLKMCSSQTWLIFMTSIKGSEKKSWKVSEWLIQSITAIKKLINKLNFKEFLREKLWAVMAINNFCSQFGNRLLMYASTKSWQNGLIKPIILISIEIEFGVAIFTIFWRFAFQTREKLLQVHVSCLRPFPFAFCCIRAFYVYRNGEKTR